MAAAVLASAPGFVLAVPEDQDPPGCNTTALNVSITKDPAGEVCDGATINYIVCFQNPTRALPQIQCAATEVKGFLDLPGPSPRTQVFSRARLNPGDPQICCPGGVGCDTNAALYTYIVSHADEIASRVQATGDADGTAHSAPGDPDQATGSAQVSNLVRHPRLTVTKECVLPVPPFPNPIPFRGTVCNTGDAILSGLTVVDDKAGPLVCRDGTGAAVDTLGAGDCCSYTGQYVPNSCSNPSDFTNTVRATGIAETIDTRSTCNRTVTDSATAVCRPTATPALTVAKRCTGFADGRIGVAADVTNTGTDVLQNIRVNDNRAGALDCSACPASLALGASCTCTGSYAPTDPLACEDTNQVVATGTGVCSGQDATATASATCPIPHTSNISVVKTCEGFANGRFQISARITNTGDDRLVVGVGGVTDDRAGLLDCSACPAILAPGASCTCTGSYAPADPQACDEQNTVTARGTGECTRQPVVASDTKTCTIPHTSSISVVKTCEGFTSGRIQISARITNTGNDRLLNVGVTDNKAGPLDCSACPGSLAPGASCTCTGSYAPPNPLACDDQNTVTASGRGECTQQAVQATDTKTCEIPHVSNISVVKTCEGFTSGRIQISARITNTGNDRLLNVGATDNKAGALSCTGCSNLAPGASCTCTGSYAPTDPLACDDQNTVTASGRGECTQQTVQAADTKTCTIPHTANVTITKTCQDASSQGSPINVTVTVSNSGDDVLEGCVISDPLATLNCPASCATLSPGSSCICTGSYTPTECGSSTNTASVTCTGRCTRSTVTRSSSATCNVPCPTRGCRITAGGIVATDTGDLITDPTLLAAVQRATFGGQVGAPYGIVGCHDDFDQIQGQWTHMRHSRRGTFHAADYLSLVCACDEGNGLVRQGELCNPGDRDPGPEPRPAPANIACFTGVGQFNRTNGRRTTTVAFRVNVEDRGEPGAGSNAGSLSDKYRIEIWIPKTTLDLNQILDQVCCLDPTSQPSQNLYQDRYIDGGNLIRGNIQIHPPTGNPRNP